MVASAAPVLSHAVRHLLVSSLLVVCLVATRADAGPLDACGLEDPAMAALAPPIEARAHALRDTTGLPPAVVRIEPRAPGSPRSLGHRPHPGALTGKTVYVSAGHGWFWTGSAWATQRGNTFDLVEDFISTETVAQHLIPLLQAMGAYVVPVRESDRTPAMVIVDDADPALSFAGLTTTTSTEGWGAPPAVITDGANPFGLGGSAITAGDGGGTATWVFDVPTAADYSVYVSWVQAPDRASNAHYVVRHAGGEAHFQVDQRRHGSTWVLLGRFPFEAGADPARGAVVLVADAAAGTKLSIDAVRIGGGTGRIARGAAASGRPRYEEAARYAAQWNGAPASVWDAAAADNNDDVSSRSRFSAWEHEPGEDAAYVAWHTNAPNPGVGTESFAYGPSSYGPVSEFTGVPGSLELMNAIHTQLVGDLKAAFDPAWRDRGQHTAYFGEINPSHNSEMPATLIEVAFHSTQTNADALREPRFRYLAARAIARGVARYFATKDGKTLVLPPEPPTGLRATQGAGGIVLAWAPPAAGPAAGGTPSGYRVYLSRDGQAFDAGRDVTEPLLTLSAEEVGAAPVFARISAVNAGGESRPSPVIGARRAGSGTARVLVIGGFDRLTGDMFIPEDLSAFNLATIDRGPEDRLNDGSYVARHGLAIGAAGYSFDAITRDAIGDIDLGAYAAIDWVAGRDGITAEAAALTAYLDGGGRLLLSGSDLALGLDPALARRFGVTFAATAPTSGAATGIAFPFDGLAEIAIGDDAWGGLRPPTEDALTAAGSQIALRFAAGTVAGTYLDEPATGARAIVLAFPIEALADADARTDVIARALGAFEVPVDEGEPMPEPPSDEGGCCDGGAGSGSIGLALAIGALLRRRRRAPR